MAYDIAKDNANVIRHLKTNLQYDPTGKPIKYRMYIVRIRAVTRFSITLTIRKVAGEPPIFIITYDIGRLKIRIAVSQIEYTFIFPVASIVIHKGAWIASIKQ
jgi:hypothetical protein